MPRVHLLAEMENVGSQKVALAAGFRHEGLQRGAGPVSGGGRADMAVFGRLPGDSGEPIRPFLPFLPPGGLTDGVVTLTMLTADDAPAYQVVASLPDVVKYRVPPEAPPFEETLYRCRGAGYRWLIGIQAEMAIRDAATGAFAGDIQLSHLTPPMREAMVGYSLHSDFRGRGLVTQGGRAAGGLGVHPGVDAAADLRHQPRQPGLPGGPGAGRIHPGPDPEGVPARPRRHVDRQRRVAQTPLNRRTVAANAASVPSRARSISASVWAVDRNQLCQGWT